MKAYELNGVDTTSFLKNIVALMSLFIFDFLKIVLIKRGNPLLLKNYLNIENLFVKSFFLNTLDTSLANCTFFLKLLFLPVFVL